MQVTLLGNGLVGLGQGGEEAAAEAGHNLPPRQNLFWVWTVTALRHGERSSGTARGYMTHWEIHHDS